MQYILVGLVIVLLLMIFNIIGKMIQLRFNLSFRFNIPLGYVFCLALCQIVGVSTIMLQASTRTFAVIYFLAMSLILMWWSMQIKRKRGLSIQLLQIDNKHELTTAKHWKNVGVYLAGALFIYINIMQYYNVDRMSDSAFYIPHILENINAEQIYSLNPWSGIQEPFNSLYVYVTFELFHSMILHVFPIHELLYINHAMSFLTFIMIILCTCELAFKLFDKKRAFLSIIFWLFIAFVFINNIRDNYFFFFSTDLIQRLPYTGKVLAYFALIPLFYTCFIEYFKSSEEKNKHLTWVLALLNIAIMSLTSTGFFIIGIYYAGILLFLVWSKKQRFEDVLLLTLSTIPLALFVILAKFPILTIPVLVMYGILYICYKKQANFIYLLIKYGVTIVSVLIPLMSLVLQFLSTRTELNIFNLSDFFGRLSISLSVNGLLIWVIAVIGGVVCIKYSSQSEVNKLLFVKVPLYLVIIFINPISCAFVATFMTSQSVYHRLFYVLPLFPLISFFVIKVVEVIKVVLPNQAIYTAAVSSLSALLLYQGYNASTALVANKLLNSNYSYKNMVAYNHYDTSQMLSESVPANAKVAMYFKDNVWADELRSLRSLSPHVILPYNTYTHRRLTEHEEYTKDDYYNYQIMLLLNATTSVYDLFIDEDGNLTEMTNGEVLIDYLIENYDYVVFPKYYDNKGLLRELFKRGKKVINSTDREYLIEL